MRVVVFQVNALAGVVNQSNRPVQGLGKISLHVHDLVAMKAFMFKSVRTKSQRLS
jgi:hypothetical protein